MFWAILDLARTILLPVVSAFVIGTMLGPLSAFASRYRVPSWLSATVLMAALIGLVWLAVTLLSAPVIEWIGKAPDIGSTIRDKLEVFERPLATLRELRNAIMAKGSDGTTLVALRDSGFRLDKGRCADVVHREATVDQLEHARGIDSQRASNGIVQREGHRGV